MRKISNKEKLRRNRLRKKRERRRLSKRWKRRQSRKHIVRIVAPALFSLHRNYHATVQCLISLKDVTCASNLVDSERLYHVYLDLRPIKEIAVAAALVLAAEIDRWQRLNGRHLSPISIREWSPQVRGMLSDLGFFELLGVPEGRGFRQRYDAEGVTVLPMVSYTVLDGRKIAALQGHLAKVADVLEQDPLIYDALTEAAYNSILHAYPDGTDFKYRVLEKRWWATAQWSPARKEVRFLVYDQGVGIAATLPTSNLRERIRAWLGESNELASMVLKEDAMMIEAAMEASRTSLTDGHGQGLCDIMRPVESPEGGSLKILSGRGQVLYARGKIRKTEHRLHLGGTLIEWAIPVQPAKE